MKRWFQNLTSTKTAKSSFRPTVEALEDLLLPSTVNVYAAQAIRTATAQTLGVNLTGWDGMLAQDSYNPAATTPDAKTVQFLKNAGMGLVRLSSGSGTDEWHFNVENDPNGFTSGAGLMANVAKAAGAQAIVTVNFGTGTPQEAAAYLAYLNGSVNNNFVIGVDANGQDWGTVADWASLRSQTALAQDDGLNHLRVGQANPFGFKYFEVGNEAYFGAWQGYQMPDPVQYVSFSKQFADLAANIDPNASIGLGVGNAGEWDDAWNVPVLQEAANEGFTPGWISDHFYVYDGNNETALSDKQLLQNSVSNSTSTMPIHGSSPRNFAGRAAAYRELLNENLGAAASSVKLLCAEFNSDADASNKQSTSLVHGLFFADAIGSIQGTEYQGLVAWDLRNYYQTMPNNSSFYGWRTGADDGMLGTWSDGSTTPATGPYVPYASYFAEQLAGKMIHTGDRVVKAVSNSATLSVYAVREQNGHLSLLVINKSSTATDKTTFNVSGFVPKTSVVGYTYGKTEDTAQSKTRDGSAKLTQKTATLAVTSLAGGNSRFTISFAPYSMTVIDLTPKTASAFPAVMGIQPSDMLVQPHSAGQSAGKQSSVVTMTQPAAANHDPAPAKKQTVDLSPVRIRQQQQAARLALALELGLERR